MAYRRRSYSVPRARWLDTKFEGTCAECHQAIPAGSRAWWDGPNGGICCTDLACAKAHGLTRQEWVGSPVSGRWADVLTDRRIGSNMVRDPGEDMADRWSETH